MNLRIIFFTLFISSYSLGLAQSDNEIVGIRVEKLPEFKYENYKTFREFILDDIEFSEDMFESIKGEQKFYFNYVVDSTGKVKDVKLLREESNVLTEIVIKRIESSPIWIPATVNDKPVDCRMTLPIVFKNE